MEHVILVDEFDNVLGTMEKIDAHKKGLLHRAFSILIFNSKGEMLLQQRSWKKYHSAGLWTNTCCSHPLPGETMLQATTRKLMQEMGIDVDLKFAYKFKYRAPVDNGLTEHELDHVFTGLFDGTPKINQDEVESWSFSSIEALKGEIQRTPEAFTYWFRLIVAEPRASLKAVSG